MPEKGNSPQPMRPGKATSYLPILIHSLSTPPLLTVLCSTLNRQTCQALPYPWAFAHSIHSVGNALSSTSRSFSSSQKPFICHFCRGGDVPHQLILHELISLFVSFMAFSIICQYFIYCLLFSILVFLTRIWVSWWQLNIRLLIIVLQDIELCLVCDRQSIIYFFLNKWTNQWPYGQWE